MSYLLGKIVKFLTHFSLFFSKDKRKVLNSRFRYMLELTYNDKFIAGFAFLFNCTPRGRTSDSMMVSDLKTYLLMRW